MSPPLTPPQKPEWAIVESRVEMIKNPTMLQLLGELGPSCLGFSVGRGLMGFLSSHFSPASRRVLSGDCVMLKGEGRASTKEVQGNALVLLKARGRRNRGFGCFLPAQSLFVYVFERDRGGGRQEREGERLSQHSENKVKPGGKQEIGRWMVGPRPIYTQDMISRSTKLKVFLSLFGGIALRVRSCSFLCAYYSPSFPSSH